MQYYLMLGNIFGGVTSLPRRALPLGQRDLAAPPTSMLPPTFTQVSVPWTFTKPGPNAAQGLPAVLFAGGSRSGGVDRSSFVRFAGSARTAEPDTTAMIVARKKVRIISSYHAPPDFASWPLKRFGCLGTRGRTGLIRATPPCEGPQSSASRLIARHEQSMKIL